jgi:hypothetical protein
MEQIIELILAQLPDFLVLPLVLVTTAALVSTRWIKFPAPIRGVIKSLHKGVVTSDRVEKAVEEILSNFTWKGEFKTWLGSTVSKLLIKFPDFFDLPEDVQRSVVASIYSKLPMKRQTDILPTLKSVSTSRFGRKATIKRLLEVRPEYLGAAKLENGV